MLRCVALTTVVALKKLRYVCAPPPLPMVMPLRIGVETGVGVGAGAGGRPPPALRNYYCSPPEICNFLVL